MTDPETIKYQIHEAFATVKFPGKRCIRDSDEGDEPFLLEQDFKDKTDWRTLDPSFIDQAPDGFGSALSFFSREAFRFYLPAYLIADINGLLERSDPVFHLCYGLDNKTKNEYINPKRYGKRTWFEEMQHRFAIFNQSEASALVSYLLWKRELSEYDRDSIDQAIKNYWLG